MKKSQSILIAEDDVFLADMLLKVFKRHGVKASAAKGGQEALDALEKHQPTLLLLDLLMPGVDGYDVLQVRKERGWKFPVVVLSNLGDKETQKKCKEWGCSEYFVKSNIDDEQLWPVVEKLLHA